MKKIIALALLALPLAGCNLITVAENHGPFPATGDDVVNVLMDSARPSNMTERCLDMGGDPQVDVLGNPICWNVDH